MQKRIIFLMVFLFTTITITIAQTQADSVKTYIIKVTGIGCDGDMTVIKKKLINQEGIDEVTFTDKKSGASQFTIVFHPFYISESKIKEIVESAPCCDNPDEFPYKVKPVKTKIKGK